MKKIVIGVIVALIIFYIIGVMTGEEETQTDLSDSFETETIVETEPTMSKEEYIQACEEYSYDDLLRYPDENYGKKIAFKAKVSQIVDNGDYVEYRCFTDYSYSTEDTSWMIDNEMLIIDSRSEDAVPIIQDDVIIVYGSYAGTQTITRALTGTEDSIPVVYMAYSEIQQDVDNVVNDYMNQYY